MTDFRTAIDASLIEGRNKAIVTKATTIRALPRFNSELLALLVDLLDEYTSRPALHIVMNDRGRFLVMLAARHLHHMPDRRGHRLSKVRLSASCERWQICSRGRARAIASRLRWAGFIDVGPAVRDGRARPIVPTAKMDDVLDRLWRRLYEMTARLLPEHCPFVSALNHDAGLMRSVEWAFISLISSGVRLLDHTPTLQTLAESNSGFAIAAFTVLKAATGQPQQSIASLARQFSVSRAHVRKVTQIAELDSLFDADAQPADLLDRPPLYEEIAALVASLLVILIEVGSARQMAAQAQ